MNIFALSRDPSECAVYHVDRHVIKMPIEYAQLLSTAHRMLDGKLEERVQPSNRTKKFMLLQGEELILQDKWVIQNQQCYLNTHVNHPCAIWARATKQNYMWLFSLFAAISREFEYRYGKPHKSWETLNKFLSNAPQHIPDGDLQEFAQAMPDCFRESDSVVAYRNYVFFDKERMLKWKKRKIPTWAPLLTSVSTKLTQVV